MIKIRSLADDLDMEASCPDPVAEKLKMTLKDPQLTELKKCEDRSEEFCLSLSRSLTGPCTFRKLRAC